MVKFLQTTLFYYLPEFYPKLYHFGCEVIRTDYKYICIIALTTLKTPTWVAETWRWSLCNKIAFIKPMCICWSFWLILYYPKYFVFYTRTYEDQEPNNVTFWCMYRVSCTVFYSDQPTHNIYVLTIFYIPWVILHVSMHLHHIQVVLSSYFAKVKYRVPDKSLARPGRKKATATEYFDFRMTYL